MSVGFLSDDQESRRYWVLPDSQSKSGTKSPQKCPALTISSSNPKVCINQQRLGLTWGSESKSSNLVKFEMFSFKGVVLRWVYLCLHPIYRLITEPPQLFPIFMCQSGNKEEKKKSGGDLNTNLQSFTAYVGCFWRPDLRCTFLTTQGAISWKDLILGGVGNRTPQWNLVGTQKSNQWKYWANDFQIYNR